MLMSLAWSLDASLLVVYAMLDDKDPRTWEKLESELKAAGHPQLNTNAKDVSSGTFARRIKMCREDKDSRVRLLGHQYQEMVSYAPCVRQDKSNGGKSTLVRENLQRTKIILNYKPPPPGHRPGSNVHHFDKGLASQKSGCHIHCTYCPLMKGNNKGAGHPNPFKVESKLL